MIVTIRPSLRGAFFATKQSIFFIFFLFFTLLTSTVASAGSLCDHPPAQRIVSLAPDITENLFAIGAGSKIVGVDSGSDYPEAARAIPRVGSYTGLDIERIVALHPDLVITWGQTFARQLAVLQALGINVYVTHPTHLTDIPLILRQLGCLTGHVNDANQIAQDFEITLQQLREHYHTRHPIRVFYEVSAEPLITINQHSWINDVIRLCGGENIFAHTPFIAPKVDVESVLAQNPAVMISGADDNHWQQRWLAFPSIQAVRQHAFLTLNPSTIDRASPRVLEGVREVCRYL